MPGEVRKNLQIF